MSLKRFGPLDGLRVLDLSRILAGPYATMMLGDMGAEIIKIERPFVGDDTRTWGPPFTKQGRESAYFLSVNRNKKSVVVDLKTPKGLDKITQLMASADVVVENFAPGDAIKLGLDRTRFRSLFPKLIWCSITGYGPDGPLMNRLGYAVLVEAHAGLMNSTGPRGGEPVKSGVALTDILTGLHASTAILAAIHNRSITGQGCLIDCSLLESQVSAMANIASNYLNCGQEAERLGTDHASIVPYGCLKVKDGMIAIGAGNDRQFLGLLRCLGIPHLASDDRFKTNAMRVNNREELRGLLENVLGSKTKNEWIAAFETVEESDRFAFAPVNNMEQVFSDPQVLHRKMVLEMDHPTAGKIKLPGVPIKFPELESRLHYAPPTLGQHTSEFT
jgi:succinate--hydroxymethylglutarate CoA-transferase